MNLKKKIVNENYRPQFKQPIKKSLENIITRCLSPDPAKRPTFNEIFEKVSDIKSIINKDENGCFLDGINANKDENVDDIQDYIESITSVNDPIIEIDKYLTKISKQNSKLSQNLIKQIELNIQLQKLNANLLKHKKYFFYLV